MKLIYIIIIISSLLFLSSCKKNIGKSFNKFPVSYTLKGKKADDNFIFKTGLVDVYDSLLIITSTPQTTQCIHVYNKNTFQHMISTGDIGKGPSEIINPGLGCVDKQNGIIWYRDMGRQKIWKYEIVKMLTEKNHKPVQFIPLPPGHFFIQFESSAMNTISFANTDENILISYFNQKGEIIDSLNVEDKICLYGRTTEDSRKFILNYFYTDHPFKKLHAIAYRFADVFAIVGQKGNVISIVRGPDHFQQNPDYNKLDQTIAYSGIYSNEKFIYCLYSGKKRMEEKDGEMVVNQEKTLHVFNWNGEPVASVNLEYSAMSFDIDEQNNRLVTFAAETGGIVYYQLPKL